MRLESIGTTEQLADMLMKALGKERFCWLRSKIGVIDVKHMHKNSEEILLVILCMLDRTACLCF